MSRLCSVFIALCASAPALAAGDDESWYSLNFDFNPPDYAGCGEWSYQDAQMSCDAIDTDWYYWGDGDWNFNRVMIYVGGATPGHGIGGVQFGIEYDETVRMSSSWSNCTGGWEIPQNDANGTWPGSGTGNALTWPGGCYEVTENDDGVTRIGLLDILPGEGLIRITGDPRVGMARAATCEGVVIPLCDALLGVGDLTSDGDQDVNTCGFTCPVPVRDTSWSGIKRQFR